MQHCLAAFGFAARDITLKMAHTTRLGPDAIQRI